MQEEFVDRPQAAVHEADRLITSLMRERGYPTEGYEQQVEDTPVADLVQTLAATFARHKQEPEAQ